MKCRPFQPGTEEESGWRIWVRHTRNVMGCPLWPAGSPPLERSQSMGRVNISDDRCVVCGAVVEEGRWVCVCCERQIESAPKRPAAQTPQKKEAPKICRWFGRKKTEK